MKTYIALLRGINVSGQKLIKMDLLKTVLKELEYQNIRTYIQSGNIVFDYKETDTKNLEQQITAHIEKHFGFQVPVTILTVDNLKAIISQNPYSKRDLTDPAQPYVAFLSETPTKEGVTVLDTVKFGDDEYTIQGKSMYVLYAQSAGTSKLSNSAIENKLKVKSTMRNWKTVHKLIEMAEAN